MLFCSFNEGYGTDNFYLFLSSIIQTVAIRPNSAVRCIQGKKASERTSVLNKHQSTEQRQMTTKGVILNDRQVNDKSFGGRFKCLALHFKCNQRKMQAAK